MANGNVPPGLQGETAPENLSNSASKENSSGVAINENNVTMMHHSFQHDKHDANTDSSLAKSNVNEKTYTELKLYKDHQQNQHLTQALHAQMQNDPRLMAALEQNSDEGSDGSDSEEIDLTSGSCIDFSNKHSGVTVDTTGTTTTLHAQQIQQQQQLQPNQMVVASNGVH